jgi:hypothetical protein
MRSRAKGLAQTQQLPQQPAQRHPQLLQTMPFQWKQTRQHPIQVGNTAGWMHDDCLAHVLQ